MPSFLLKELYMRIDKYISGCGYASRKDVKKLIKQGLVFIDGEVCKKPEEQTDENSIVEVDGERLIYREFVYLMLNKPQVCLRDIPQNVRIPPEQIRLQRDTSYHKQHLRKKRKA